MKKAFSLIELSIVILIIGVIIAGVTSSTRLINAMRLNTAQQITKSSAVNSIPGLVLWLEPTLSDSFLDSETSDGTSLTTWKDINPQSSIRNTVSRGTSDSKIQYKSNGLNKIPAVYFSGSTGTTAALSNSVITSSDNSYSFFIAMKLDSTATNAITPFYNGNSTTNGWGYEIYNFPPKLRTALFGGNSWNNELSSSITTNPEIISVIATNSTVSLYVNGTQDTLAAVAGNMATPSGYLSVGSSYNGTALGTDVIQGYISEVIMFDRKLKAEERTSIEQYLSKKYNIALH